ncbi:hypothetical protein ANCDUO_05815 [Ancylostoma duodenale]|uniref:LIM interaction domain-containing protein n=1 Tax=Ancylostoma duodenale TaxID=51022 RepID=A0A0C2H3A0_9BILA|nr:hypothetical protein ANCDUO_05815 [Ancylostoma duodenale]
MTRTLFAHHTKMQQQQQMAMQHMNQPSMLPPTTVEEQKPKPARKRQRKTTTNSKNKKANASPAPTNAGFPSNPMPGNDVMVVGEPSMMGGDYGEEDERTISRVENAQYDPNALQLQMQSMGPSGHIGGPGMSGMQSGPPMGPPSASQMSAAGPQLVPGGPQMVQAGAIGPGSVQMGPGIPSAANQQLTQLGQPQNGHPPPQGYGYGQAQPSAWSNPSSNAAMITG